MINHLVVSVNPFVLKGTKDVGTADQSPHEEIVIGTDSSGMTSEELINAQTLYADAVQQSQAQYYTFANDNPFGAPIAMHPDHKYAASIEHKNPGRINYYQDLRDGPEFIA